MKTLQSILAIIVLLLITFTTQAQEIFDAIRTGDLAKVKELVENDPQLLKSKNARQSTPLHVAAAYDNEEIAKYLIEKGSDINILNGNFYTPLMFSGIKVSKLLVEKGADINFKSQNGWSALAEAFWRGKNDVAEYLIDKGVNIGDLQTVEDRNMLIAALRAGSINYLEKCLQKGLKPGFESEAKSGLLHFASESNSAILVKRLVELRADVNKTNIYGWTPLHTAAWYGNKSVVELLTQNGMDINARTIDGKTPYNLAIEAKMMDVADYLVSIGAELSTQKFPVITGDYLGEPVPGKKAVPFAPGILSSQYNYHTNIVFTPDGKELYGKSMMPMSFLYSKLINGKWTSPDTLTNMNYHDAPFISPDGSRFYFVASVQQQGQQLQELIYVMDKTPTGWSPPYHLPEIINSIQGIHWQVSVDRKANLYFGARQNGTVISRIYYSEYRNGSYTVPKMMEILRETDAHSPFIAPDGSYLIISTPTKGLQILFRKKDGSWTKEKNITEIIGYEGHCPIVTHDGKYLFFLHYIGDRFVPYWVSAKFIEELRPKAF